MEKSTVAVIGAGPAGLAALKNLREEDFSVTVFEKRNSVGGVWAYTDDVNLTTTLPSTLSNGSKFHNAFTDFPIPDDIPAYLTQTQALDYIKAYAAHFDLNRHVKFNTSVQCIKRDEGLRKWKVSVLNEKGDEAFLFDKVVICSGLAAKAITPQFDGVEIFEGKIIHSQAFRRPADFEGIKVLVVGLSHTAADIATELVGHAKKIYLSHRSGVKLIPRFHQGKPLDYMMNRQMIYLKFALEKYFPSLGRWAFDFFTDQLTKKHFALDPKWRFLPGPSLTTHIPLVHDKIFPNLQAGDINSVHGLSHFLDESTVELLDGTRLIIDAVIFCTGYKPDFSLLGPDLDPTGPSKNMNGDTNLGLANLYQNIFPLEHADSVAYMNYYRLSVGAYTVADLTAMAIAQVWKGAYSLPSRENMEAEIDKQRAWKANLTKGCKTGLWSGILREGPWFQFLNAAAGTGINENLGYGWEGWKFWWKQKELCDVIMKGPNSPYVYRLFEGRRKKWDGAREAIVRLNEDAKRRGR